MQAVTEQIRGNFLPYLSARFGKKIELMAQLKKNELGMRFLSQLGSHCKLSFYYQLIRLSSERVYEMM